MKHFYRPLVWMLSVVFVTACGGNGNGSGEKETPKEKKGKPRAVAVIALQPPIILDRASAAGKVPGQRTPVDAVVHFYASILRGDEKYKEVAVPATENSAFASQVAWVVGKYKKWLIREVTVLSQEYVGENFCWIRIDMALEIDRKPYKIADHQAEVELQLLKGKWYLLSPPHVLQLLE